jgi:manganese-dependent inorganic pyrophosphatase
MKYIDQIKILFLLISIFLAPKFSAANGAEIQKETVVIGHLNPDPDSIGGAIAAANYFGATPARTGKITKESKFLLDLFDIEAPAYIKDFKNKDIIAIDFNQKFQAPKNIADGRLIRIIDHHALLEAPITSLKPIPVEIKPWGSACTIIAKNYFLRNKRQIPKGIAGLLLGGILSDTLNLRSETTTKHDRQMVAHLAKIAGIKDINELAFNMFKAKSDVSDLNDAQVISADFKEFSLGNKRVGIGVSETVVPKDLLDRKEGLIEAGLCLKKKEGFDYLFFFIVDIYKIKSQLIIIDKPEQLVAEEAFGGKVNGNVLDTRDLVSRKLQIGPIFSEYFSKGHKFTRSVNF